MSFLDSIDVFRAIISAEFHGIAREKKMEDVGAWREKELQGIYLNVNWMGGFTARSG